VGWSFAPSSAPPSHVTEAVKEENQVALGVLRATLEADELSGNVLTPQMTGAIKVHALASTGLQLLGETSIDGEGGFRVGAPTLEERSWRGGRLVVRVVDSKGRTAEGFVSIASFGEIVRRVGQVGRRLIALVAGAETPADVAAIMDWFHQNPEHLLSVVSRHGDVSNDHEDPHQLVSVASLRSVTTALPVVDSASVQHIGSKRWSRFIQQVFSAFREPRGPLGRTETRSDDEEDDEDALIPPGEPPRDNPEIQKALATFDELLTVLCSAEAPRENVGVALALSEYTCDRLRPPESDVTRWLAQILRSAARVGVPAGHEKAAIAAIMAWLGGAPTPQAYRWARERLLELKVDFAAPLTATDRASGFLAVLPQQASTAELWSKLARTRTYGEQVGAYVSALKDRMPNSGYPDLAEALPSEWPALEKAVVSESATRRLVFSTGTSDACPKCDMILPLGEAHKLKAIGVATAKNCCGRIVIRLRS
jgi:hypothetical protein